MTSFMIAFAWDYWVLLGRTRGGRHCSVMFTVSAMGLLVRLSLPTCAAVFPVITRRRSCWATCWARSLRAPWAPFGLRAPFIVYGFSLLVAGLIVWFLMPSQATLEAERDAIAEAARLAERKGTGTLPSESPSPLLTAPSALRLKLIPPPRLSLLPRHRLTPPTRPPTPRPPRVGATCRR